MHKERRGKRTNYYAPPIVLFCRRAGYDILVLSDQTKTVAKNAVSQNAVRKPFEFANHDLNEYAITVSTNHLQQEE